MPGVFQTAPTRLRPRLRASAWVGVALLVAMLPRDMRLRADSTEPAAAKNGAAHHPEWAPPVHGVSLGRPRRYNDRYPKAWMYGDTFYTAWAGDDRLYVVTDDTGGWDKLTPWAGGPAGSNLMVGLLEPRTRYFSSSPRCGYPRSGRLTTNSASAGNTPWTPICSTFHSFQRNSYIRI